MSVGLQEVDAADEAGEMLINSDVRPGQFALQPAKIRRLYDCWAKSELLGELLRPLIAQVRWTQDQHAPDKATVEHLARDHARLDRLADADIVGDQQADGIELEGENKRQELVRPRPERKPTGAPKRRGAAPEEQAARIEQKPTRSRIANDARVGTAKARGLDAVAFERNKEPDGGAVSACYRLEIENVLSGRRQDDPRRARARLQCFQLQMFRHSPRTLRT